MEYYVIVLCHVLELFSFITDTLLHACQRALIRTYTQSMITRNV